VDAGDAVDAAVGMQEAITSSGLAASGIHIRMGLHSGAVHVRAGNYSGEVVTMAARMVTLAKPGCIVATGDVLEQAGERVARRFAPLTGEAASRLNLDLYEVSWRSDAAAGEAADAESSAGQGVPLHGDSPPSKRKTTVSRLQPRSTVSGMPVRKVALREVSSECEAPTELPPEPSPVVPAGSPAAPARHATEVEVTVQPSPPPAAPPAAAPRANRLCLIWREKVLLVDSKTSVTMGRDERNDIVLQVSTASRRHAEVCCRDGQFLVIDRSANGTFVYDEKGSEYFVHQCEARLAESGAICPGCPQEEPGCEALLYWMAE